MVTLHNCDLSSLCLMLPTHVCCHIGSTMDIQLPQNHVSADGCDGTLDFFQVMCGEKPKRLQHPQMVPKKNNICQTPVQQNAQSSFPRVKTKQKTPHVQNGKSKQSRITRAKTGPKRNSNKVRKNKKCDTDIAWCIGFLKQPLRSMATFHHIVTAFFLSSTRKKNQSKLFFWEGFHL